MWLILAQSAPTTTDPINLLISYGVPGIVIFALITGYLWAKPAVEQLKADKKSAEEQRDKLIELFDSTTDALTANAKAVESLSPLIAELKVLVQQRNRATAPSRKKET